jgi:hypothetical protein
MEIKGKGSMFTYWLDPCLTSQELLDEVTDPTALQTIISGVETAFDSNLDDKRDTI